MRAADRAPEPAPAPDVQVTLDRARRLGHRLPSVQRKVLRSDLKNLGSGAAGQWHLGDPDFHVTVYGDDPIHVAGRGFTYIGPRWVSEFHVSKKRPTHTFGRRFYDIDTGTKVGRDEGTISGHDDLATEFMDRVVKRVAHYGDKDAGSLQTQWDEEEQQRGSEKTRTIQEITTRIAEKYAGQEIDWDKTSSYRILGEITRALKEANIYDLLGQQVKDEFDLALNAINERIAREREAKEREESGEKVEEKSAQSSRRTTTTTTTTTRERASVLQRVRSGVVSAVTNPIVLAVGTILAAAAVKYFFF